MMVNGTSLGQASSSRIIAIVRDPSTNWIWFRARTGYGDGMGWGGPVVRQGFLRCLPSDPKIVRAAVLSLWYYSYYSWVKPGLVIPR